MRKYHRNRNNIIKLLVLVTSIIVANSFIIFTSDQNSKFYFAKLTTTVTSGVAFAIALLMVYKYKTKQHQFVPHQFRTRQDIMHSSICLFFVYGKSTSDLVFLGITICRYLYRLCNHSMRKFDIAERLRF